MNKLLLAFALILCACTLPAQILINEVSAANLAGIQDGDGDREDWVELYNPSASAVNLSGWFLSDNPANPQKWVIPAGQTLGPGAYRVVFCSGKNKVAMPFLHTNFKITQTKGESVVLTQPNGTTEDIYTFNTPNQVNHSYGRSPNGSATWKIFTTPTPGVVNGNTAYLNYAPDVDASVDAGAYTGSVTVSLTTSAGLTIRYTTNGTEPTLASTTYATPLTFSTTTVLKARAFSGNAQVLPGFTTTKTYFINVSHTVPVISISGDNVTTLLNGTQTRPYGTFEYFEDGDLKEDGVGEMNKHGNDSWAYPQRGIDWITRDQLGYNDDLKQKFFKERTRNKFQRVILKAAANDNFPGETGGAHIRDSYVHTLAIQGGLNVDARTHLSCVLYVNAQYWGVYDLREKVDDADFTSYYYDQDEPEVDYIKTWGPTWAEYGSLADWNLLKSFILGNNMANPANYDYVQQQFDFLSFIDYIIINQHTVCKDWLNWNTSWWRGRNPDGEARQWRYALWDMDATFGHYINYTGIPNVGPTADPCDVEQIPNSGDPQNHIDIFTALYNNPEFKALYVNRYADLLNTSLSCAYMTALLDSMTNVIAPEMAQHCARWGGSVVQWNQNVDNLRNFINSRCQILDQSIVDCYEVTGPHVLTVQISPAAAPNNVMVNTITPTTYPYNGDYFGGVNIDLIAKPAPDWLFDHWEVNGNTFGPDQYAAAILLAFETSGVVTAFFVPVGPCLEPTDLVFTETSTTLNWTAPIGANSYLINYRKSGDPNWLTITAGQANWQVDTLPGCTQYEVQIQSICATDSSVFTPYTFTTPNTLTGFAVADTHICNAGSALLDATFPGANYTWDDGSTDPARNVTDAGSYWVMAQLNGCTVTDTIVVTKISTTNSIQPQLCPGETFVLGGTTFNEQNPTGQVTIPATLPGACDSIIQVSLTYLAPSQFFISQQSCDPAAVGTDTILLSNMVGCDSLVITTTTFDAAAISIIPVFVQNCDPAMVGIDTTLFTNAAGCDSLVITTTALAPVSQTLLAMTTCNPALAGTDTLLLSNHFGCDSLVITNTTFNPAGISTTPVFVQNCDPTMVGIDTTLFTNAAGCDSLVVTTTTLAPTSQTLLAVTTCNPAFVGTDTMLLSNHWGCDSLVITTTTFDPAAISITPVFVQNCDPAMVGIDTTFFTNAAGCDSLVVTTTTLAPTSQTLLAEATCNPALVGTDTLLLSNHFGCDSLVITTTTFDPAAISITPVFVQNCDPAMVGTDTTLFTNAAGCDSLVVTTTTLAPSSQTLLAVTTCNPALVGTDTLLLSNYLGCDSLVITSTTFDPAAISITPVFVQNCDPAMVGIDTTLFTNVAGCDSLVITTTILALSSQTLLAATTCDPALAGSDTLRLVNQFGCDSLVITNTSYTGLALTSSTLDVLCFNGQDGQITLDTVHTDFLPVEVKLANRPPQLYDGIPLVWEGLKAGTYTLTATNQQGCILQNDITLAQGAPLNLDMGQQPVLLHTGDSIWISPVTDFQIETAQWSPETGIICPDCAATFVAAQQSAVYTLTVSDPNGCTTTTFLTVQVDQGVRVFVPNIFQPESDGPESRLSIFTGPEVDRILFMRIFDRWGNQIFEQTNLTPNEPTDWDGRFRGKMTEPGVVFWVSIVQTKDGREVTLSGDITVLR